MHPRLLESNNAWMIMNPGGGPTPDKPDISLVDYTVNNAVSTLNLRVADIPGVL